MRYFRLLLISVVVFVVFVTLLSLFFPSHIRISRATDIRANGDSVLAFISQAERWKLWYPGADTAAILWAGGQPRGIITGTGRALEIKHAGDSSVVAENTGPRSRKGEDTWRILSYSGHPGSVTLHWSLDFYLHWYPWEKLAGILLEKTYGPKMEEGLTRLKKLAEKSQ